MWVLGGAEPIHSGSVEDPFPVTPSPTLRLVADPYAKPIAGYELEAQKQKEDGTWELSFTLSDKTNFKAGDPIEVTIAGKFAEAGDGKYRMRLRVKYESSDFGPWSDWCHAEKGWTPPPAPSGCRLLP